MIMINKRMERQLIFHVTMIYTVQAKFKKSLQYQIAEDNFFQKALI